jgi:hypothetical protein
VHDQRGYYDAIRTKEYKQKYHEQEQQQHQQKQQAFEA